MNASDVYRMYLVMNLRWKSERNASLTYDRSYTTSTNESLSIDEILNSFELSEKELYKIKCDIFNKYCKNKIFNI